MTSRRKFLERSAWGFGSILLSSALLQSCTLQDHIIPNPQNPVFPSLGDYDFDWNDAVKKTVTSGLEAIPEVGEILGPLVDIFWPSNSSSPWNKIKDQVDQLINQKLDTYTYTQATGKLDSLKANMQDYLKKLDDGTPAEINSTWETVHELFVNSQSSFTVDGYQVMLLPLFTQFANMFMLLLRDPLTPTKSDPSVLTGTTWGMTDRDISDYRTDLQDYIAGAVSYVSTAYDNGRSNVLRIEADDLKVEPFRSTNAYDRQMTMLVLDYMDSWPYYDITNYPNGAKNPDNTPIQLFTREIYSDPYGNIVNSSSDPYPNLILPSPATQFPTQLTVWSGVRINAVQLTYPAGSGPDGVTTTPRMGDRNGGSPQTFDLSNLAINQAQVGVDRPPYDTANSLLITTLQLSFTNNTAIPPLGETTPNSKNSGSIGYPDYAVSSIYIHGSNLFEPKNSADCIVFGFKRWPQ